MSGWSVAHDAPHDWAVTHEELPDSDRVHSLADAAEAHGRTAMAAAHMAGQHAEYARAAAQKVAEHVGDASSSAKAAQEAADGMRHIAGVMGAQVAAFREVAGLLRDVVKELRAPREVRIVKRNPDGSVAKAVSEVKS